jgi:pimeloyl-ACP methyl ester carboxylesterase
MFVSENGIATADDSRRTEFIRLALAALTAHLDLHDAVHIGHSAGGGEVARYVGRHGESRVAVVDPATATRAAMRVANGTLKTYPGYPHGMPVTHADVLNPDLLAFIRS